VNKSFLGQIDNSPISVESKKSCVHTCLC